MIELVSPKYIRNYYSVISQEVGLEHYYLKGEDFGCAPIRQLMYQNPVVDTLVSLTDLSLYETQGLTGYAMYDRRPGHLGPENHQQLYHHVSKFLFGIIKEPVYRQGSDYEHYKHYIS